MELRIKTSKHNEFIEITEQAKDFVKSSKVKEGILLVYAQHTTAAVTVNENADSNIKEDIIKALAGLIPENKDYLHNKIDNNAAAHIKSALIGCSKLIPIKDNELQLGQFQNIFLCEFDGPRQRTVIFKVID